MSKKSRYLILTGLFVVFVIFAPVILLYVGGINYDFHKHAFVKTGILAVRTEPKNSEIFVNGKLAAKNSGDIKFLSSGEYEVRVQSPGYRAWSKRLPVRENQVTWVSPAGSKIFLFKSDTSARTIANEVIDFAQTQDQIFYLTKGSLISSSLSNPAISENFTVPASIDSVQASVDNPFVMLTSGNASATALTILAFNRDKKTLTDISELFKSLPEFQLASDGSLLALENGSLYHIDVEAAKKTLLFSGVLDFSTLADRFYFLKSSKSGAVLESSLLAAPEEPISLASLPPFSKSRILVTQQKQILLLLDSTLYAVSGTLVKITDTVNDLRFDQSNSALAVINGGEADYYDFSLQQTRFITRSSQILRQPIVNFFTNTAFLVRNSDLVGLELDLRDRQNEYDFYHGDAIAKFTISDDAKVALVLDAGKLAALQLR